MYLMTWQHNIIVIFSLPAVCRTVSHCHARTWWVAWYRHLSKLHACSGCCCRQCWTLRSLHWSVQMVCETWNSCDEVIHTNIKCIGSVTDVRKNRCSPVDWLSECSSRPQPWRAVCLPYSLLDGDGSAESSCSGQWWTNSHHICSTCLQPFKQWIMKHLSTAWRYHWSISFSSHILKTLSAHFATLHRIHSICRYSTRPTLQSLVVSLCLTRMDCGCTTRVGLSMRQLKRQQYVLIAAARMIYSARRNKHVSSLLHDLLLVPQWNEFRHAVLVYCCLSGTVP